MNKKFALLKAIVAIFVSLNFYSTQAQDTLILGDTFVINIANPIYIKGCGQAANGNVSIIGSKLHVNCPYCCQGMLWGSATIPAHRCNIPKSQCSISSPQYIAGTCPICTEIVNGMMPDGGFGVKIIVYAVGRYWWVTGLKGTINPEGHSILEADIIGQVEGEILP